jgi:hypothetical protein
MTHTPYRPTLKKALAAVHAGAESACVPCAHPWGSVRYVRCGSRIVRQVESDAGKTLSERMLPSRNLPECTGSRLIIWMGEE